MAIYGFECYVISCFCIKNKQKILNDNHGKLPRESVTKDPIIIRQILTTLIEHSDGRKDENAVLIEGLDRRHLRQSVNATFHLHKEAFPDEKISLSSFCRIVSEWNSQYRGVYQ